MITIKDAFRVYTADTAVVGKRSKENTYVCTCAGGAKVRGEHIRVVCTFAPGGQRSKENTSVSSKRGEHKSEIGSWQGSG